MLMDLSHCCVRPGTSIREAIAHIDANRRGIVLVVDSERRLLGTVTDGDIRRAILADTDLEAPIQVLLARKAGSAYARPISAQLGQELAEYQAILKQHGISHLPILDEAQRVIGLVTLDELLPDQPLPVQAVVMAGGLGQRLHPLTADTPKPMLELGGRPLLEIIIEQLRSAGIRQVTVTTHHKPEKIVEHFGDGRNFGVELSYMQEGRPLGTIGGLALLEPPRDTTLVMNGDILTQADFRAMLAYHREHEAELTVGVRRYDLRVPYGVVECDGSNVRRVSEKPVVGFFVNAGIYLLEPSAYRHIPPDQRFDMTDLIQTLVVAGRPVVSFPIREYWMDIGQHEDYVLAQEHIKSWKTPACGTAGASS